MGSKQDWEKVRNRLNTITNTIKKEIKQDGEAAFTSESVQARLLSPFRLAKGDRYHVFMCANALDRSSGQPELGTGHLLCAHDWHARTHDGGV